MSRITCKIREGDWQSIIKAINQLSYEKLGTQATPVWNTIELTGITASRLLYGYSNSELASVTDFTDWIAGTTNQITVADDGDGTVTLATPQDIHTGATNFTVAGATINGTLNMTDHQVQNMVLHNVADETARLAEDMVVGKVVYQADTGISYLCTSY